MGTVLAQSKRVRDFSELLREWEGVEGSRHGPARAFASEQRPEGVEADNLDDQRKFRARPIVPSEPFCLDLSAGE
jgi:hypothetical protein